MAAIVIRSKNICAVGPFVDDKFLQLDYLLMLFFYCCCRCSSISHLHNVHSSLDSHRMKQEKNVVVHHLCCHCLRPSPCNHSVAFPRKQPTSNRWTNTQRQSESKSNKEKSEDKEEEKENKIPLMLLRLPSTSQMKYFILQKWQWRKLQTK